MWLDLSIDDMQIDTVSSVHTPDLCNSDGVWTAFGYFHVRVLWKCSCSFQWCMILFLNYFSRRRRFISNRWRSDMTSNNLHLTFFNTVLHLDSWCDLHHLHVTLSRIHLNTFIKPSINVLDPSGATAQWINARHQCDMWPGGGLW